jgi:ribosomal protein L31E
MLLASPLPPTIHPWPALLLRQVSALAEVVVTVVDLVISYSVKRQRQAPAAVSSLEVVVVERVERVERAERARKAITIVLLFMSSPQLRLLLRR